MLRQLIFSQQHEEQDAHDDDGRGHADPDALVGGQQVEGPPTLLRGRRSAAATQGTCVRHC